MTTFTTRGARQMALEYLTRPRTMSQYASLDDLYAAETSERLSVVAALEADIAAPQEPAVNAELLEALRNLTDACLRADANEDLDSRIGGELLDAASAAIAKAGGAA